MLNILILTALALLIIFLLMKLFSAATIFEYEKGLLFRKGKLIKVLEPGRYWYLPSRTAIQKVDIRLKSVSIPSQEVLSADNVALKITLAAQYAVSDPIIAVTKVESYAAALYLTLQLTLRELIGDAKVDEVTAKRKEIGTKILELASAKVQEYGLTLQSADVKDITFPGDLKKIFSQVVKAQKEGQAILEKARGETAALRNLANAARMLEENPALMQLRLVQSVESGTGNTIVFGLPAGTLPIPAKKEPAKESETENHS